MLLALLVAAFLISGTEPDEARLIGAVLNVAAVAAAFAATGLGSQRRPMVLLATSGVVAAAFVGSSSSSSAAASAGAPGQALLLVAILVAVVMRILRHEEVGGRDGADLPGHSGRQARLALWWSAPPARGRRSVGVVATVIGSGWPETVAPGRMSS